MILLLPACCGELVSTCFHQVNFASFSTRVEFAKLIKLSHPLKEPKRATTVVDNELLTLNILEILSKQLNYILKQQRQGSEARLF
jgi:hypothetical protein